MMHFTRFFNSLNFVFLCVPLWLKKYKKPTPLKIAQLPQISTEIFDEGEYIPGGSSPAFNRPFSQQFPESLLYCRFQKMAFNAISTLLSPFNGGLAQPKTKKVLKPQKSQKDQPRFSGFSVFSPMVNFFESRVPTPDKDHIRDAKKFKPGDYWPHLVMNFKCAIRHIKLWR